MQMKRLLHERDVMVTTLQCFCHRYAAHLMSEGREVTTVNFYLRNVLQFLGYLQDTPPSACRLRKAQINGIVRALDKALENLSGLIVTHQLQVKTNKMGRIVSRESLRRCQEQARLVIPELLSKTVCIHEIYVDVSKRVSRVLKEFCSLSSFQPRWRRTQSTTSETISTATSWPLSSLFMDTGREYSPT